jgi:Ni,Fe-hydrogenase III small subunit
MKLSGYRKKSPWILHYNAGSCNGCDIEILACLTPKYDVERFGLINTGNPKQSDILLITGPVTKRSRERLVEIYAQMPEPKVVIACGSCASTGGVFRPMYNIEGGVDQVIPVDVYVPGCACRPEQIIDGVVEALGILEQKNKEIEKSHILHVAPQEEDGQVNRRNMAGTIKK